MMSKLCTVQTMTAHKRRGDCQRAESPRTSCWMSLQVPWRSRPSEYLGSGIAIALRLLGGTNTFSIDLAWFIRKLLELAQFPTWLISSSHEVLLDAGIIKYVSSVSLTIELPLVSGGDLSQWQWQSMRLVRQPSLGWCLMIYRWTQTPNLQTTSNACDTERSWGANCRCSQRIPSTSTCLKVHCAVRNQTHSKSRRRKKWRMTCFPA